MKSILIVEDNDDMQNLLSSMLSPTYEVIQAFSGTEGRTQFEQKQPALVLLDRMLPGLSGDELLKQIRQTSQVPVIMLTALDDSKKIADLLLNGANDYVTKPFNIDELKARITVQLRTHKHLHSS